MQTYRLIKIKNELKIIKRAYGTKIRTKTLIELEFTFIKILIQKKDRITH